MPSSHPTLTYTVADEWAEPSSRMVMDGLLAYNHPPFEILWYIPLGGLTYLQAYCA